MALIPDKQLIKTEQQYKAEKRAGMGCLVFIGVMIIIGIIGSFSGSKSQDLPATSSEPIALKKSAISKEQLQMVISNGEKVKSYIISEYDKIEKITWYHTIGSNGSEFKKFGFYLYMGRREDVPWLIFRTGFCADDWLFFDTIKLLIDDKEAYEIPFDKYKDKKEDTGYGGDIYENVDIAIDGVPELLKHLKQIPDAKTVTVRFSGKYYHDYTLSENQKKKIGYMLDYFNGLKAKYDLKNL